MKPLNSSEPARISEKLAEGVEQIATIAALVFEFTGVLLLVLLSLTAVVAALVELGRRTPASQIFEHFRISLIRALLIGLELLVVADVITTIIIDLTVSSLLALGLLIIIRTFLGFTLRLEMKGT